MPRHQHRQAHTIASSSKAFLRVAIKAIIMAAVYLLPAYLAIFHIIDKGAGLQVQAAPPLKPLLKELLSILLQYGNQYQTVVEKNILTDDYEKVIKQLPLPKPDQIYFRLELTLYTNIIFQLCYERFNANDREVAYEVLYKSGLLGEKSLSPTALKNAKNVDWRKDNVLLRLTKEQMDLYYSNAHSIYLHSRSSSVTPEGLGLECKSINKFRVHVQQDLHNPYEAMALKTKWEIYGAGELAFMYAYDSWMGRMDGLKISDIERTFKRQQKPALINIYRMVMCGLLYTKSPVHKWDEPVISETKTAANFIKSTLKGIASVFGGAGWFQDEDREYAQPVFVVLMREMGADAQTWDVNKLEANNVQTVAHNLLIMAFIADEDNEFRLTLPMCLFPYGLLPFLPSNANEQIMDLSEDYQRLTAPDPTSTSGSTSGVGDKLTLTYPQMIIFCQAEYKRFHYEFKRANPDSGTKDFKSGVYMKPDFGWTFKNQRLINLRMCFHLIYRFVEQNVFALSNMDLSPTAEKIANPFTETITTLKVVKPEPPKETTKAPQQQQSHQQNSQQQVPNNDDRDNEGEDKDSKNGKKPATGPGSNESPEDSKGPSTPSTSEATPESSTPASQPPPKVTEPPGPWWHWKNLKHNKYAHWALGLSLGIPTVYGLGYGGYELYKWFYPDDDASKLYPFTNGSSTEPPGTELSDLIWLLIVGVVFVCVGICICCISKKKKIEDNKGKTTSTAENGGKAKKPKSREPKKSPSGSNQSSMSSVSSAGGGGSRASSAAGGSSAASSATPSAKRKSRELKKSQSKSSQPSTSSGSSAKDGEKAKKPKSLMSEKSPGGSSKPSTSSGSSAGGGSGSPTSPASGGSSAATSVAPSSTNKRKSQRDGDSNAATLDASSKASTKKEPTAAKKPESEKK